MRKTSLVFLASCLAGVALLAASCGQVEPPPLPPPAPAPVPATSPGPTPAPAPEPAPPPFEKPAISPAPGLTPARDLTGTWTGAGVDYLVALGTNQRNIRSTWNVTLVLRQAGNTVVGTWAAVKTKQENLSPNINFVVPDEPATPIANGVVSGSSLSFDVGTAHWEMTFSTDLMSGQYTIAGLQNVTDPKAFTLTRQR
ncbi:MAG: hypothetical protein HYX96_00125 [Chloroflexi bacterium]|nr:hypothetical protein [Chloroflexota bacterium]